MKIAVLSDIHSNKYALLASLQFIDTQNIDKFIFLGDFFGYYPWAGETYLMLERLFSKSKLILGNHDFLLLQEYVPDPIPEYWDVLLENKKQLHKEVINWLSGLAFEQEFVLDSIHFKIYHGMPDDPKMGRYYPDNTIIYDWFPKSNEILIMGHTHYPILRKTNEDGTIINPGSIGQPRDGIVDSSFCIIDTTTKGVDFFRVPYNVDGVIEELLQLNWYPRAIQLLRKNKLICHGYNSV